MLKGCRFPAGLKWSALTLRHVSYSARYFAISRFILVHQKFFFKSWYILFVLRWIEYLEQWASSMTLWLSWRSFRTTRRSLNHKTPSASSWKYCDAPNCSLLQIWTISASIFWAAITSYLIVGMRAMLVNVPCGTTQRLSSSRWQQDVRGCTIRLLQWCMRLNEYAITFAFPRW
jgi:hypothetical protein